MDRRTFCKSTLATVVTAATPFGEILAATSRAPDTLRDLEVTSRTGERKQLEKAAVAELVDALWGRVLIPGDEGYDAARWLWNGMFDLRPGLIVRCSGSADVMTAVDFARAHDLLLSVRGGGHAGAGYGLSDGGLAIDLSPMQGVRVDPVKRTVRIGPGVLLGQLDRETQHFGLATTSGTVSTTGMAGLTLGGGIGRLARKYGLASDNLLSVDLVTADGRLLHVDESQHPDLFWGIRGGGGNFGIATSLEYRLHPVGPVVLGGHIVYPWREAKEVIRRYAEFAATAPDEFSSILRLSRSSDPQGAVSLEVFYSGELGVGEKLIEPLRRFGMPLRADVGPVQYTTVQTSEDADFPHGDLYFGAPNFIGDYTPELIDAMVEGFPDPDELPLLVSIFQAGGAIGRLPYDATAYAHRDTSADLNLILRWKDPAKTEAYVAQTLAYRKHITPHTKGFYINRMSTLDEPDVPKNFQKNLVRLVALKDAYDPTNLFRRNANVKPSAG